MADSGMWYTIKNPRKTKEITVTHVDVDGNETKEKRTIQDRTFVQGDDKTTAVFEQAIADRRNGGSGKVYKLSDGSYSNNVFDVPSTFVMDDKTGKITITAPKSVLESDWFKNNYTENDNFKALAQAYEQDPTGTTALTVYDKNGNPQQKTLQELLEDQKKAFETYSEQYKDILAIKEQADKDSSGGIKLSDNDAIIYAYSTNRNDDKFDSQKVVYIPNIAMSYFDFSTLGSWDSVSHTISAKDFYEWYNLDDGTEGKDELIDRLNDGVVQMYDQYNKTQHQLDPSERDDATAASDYARTVSFMRTLKNDNPDANVFTSVRLFVTSAVNSFADNLFQATGSVLAGISDIIDGLDSADETITPLKLVSEPLKFGRGLYRTGELMFYDIGATVTGVDISAANKQLEEMAFLGEIGDSIGDGDVSGLLETLSKDKGLSRELTARDLLTTGHELLYEAHEDMARLSSAATAGSIVGGALAEIVKQFYVTNPIGAAAGSAVTTAAIGKEGVDILAHGGTVTDVITGMNIVKSGLTAKQLAGAVKLGAVSTNIMAQGLSDTILNDEASLRRMFVEGDPTDALEAITLNTIFNGIGELSGLATSKGWDAFANKTAAGRAIDAWGSRRVAAIQYRKQRALASIADKLNSAKKATDPTSIANKEAAEVYSAWAKLEAEASEKIAHAGKYAEPGETITAATRRLRQEKIDLEVAFTRINTQGSRTIMELRTNPKVVTSLNDAEIKRGNIIKMEGALGVGEKGAKAFTQASSNYLYWTGSSKYLANKEELFGLKASEESFKTAIDQKIAAFRSANSRLADALDDFRKAQGIYEHDFWDLLMEDGIVDSESIKAMRASGLWGEDGIEFTHTQILTGKNHVDSAKNFVERMANGKNYEIKTDFDVYSYKFGDVDADALDPGLTMLSEQIATAKVIDARRWANSLIKVQPFAREIDTTGKPLSNKELNTALKEARTAANSTLKQFSSNDDILGYDFANIYKSTENLPNKIAKKQEKVTKLLDMNETRLTQTALNLDPVDIQYLRVDFDLPEYLPLRSQAQLDRLYEGATAGQKTAIDQAMGTEGRTLANYNAALRETDLGDRLVREYIASDKKLLNSKTYKDYATYLRKQQLTARQQTILSDSYKDIRKMQKTAKLMEIGEDEFTELITGFTDDLVKNITVKLDDNVVFNESVKRYVDAGVDKKLAEKYVALNSLKKELASSNTQFSTTLSKNLENIETSGNLTTKQKKRFSGAIKKALQENVESELSDVIVVLQKNGAGNILDMNSIFEDIRTYMKDVMDKEINAENVIRVLDKDGHYKLYEVSPLTAKLYTERPNFSNIKTSGLVKFFNKTNRIFKLMTTGWGLSSFENQWIRDPLNAYIMGGMVKGFNTSAEAIGQLIGPNLTEEMSKQLDVVNYNKISASAEDVGKEISEQARNTAEMFYGDTSESVKYYRQMDNVRKDTLFGDYEQEVGKMEKALETMEEHSLGNFRETYLRKSVYMNAYNNALEAGKTLKEAANWAEYVADNATTDFSRAFAWGNKLVASVPYLGAAINGTKSFWRLLEIDPVGVTGRFICGLVFPTMSLVGRSLDNPEDREVYMNIPEYMKEDNLCFVVDGEVFKIPIPQELSAFIAPFRQAVEKSYGANNHAWSDLILSDVFGLSPLELNDLVNLDDPLGKDADFWSRLSNEGEALLSQVAPVAAKTMYMFMTGRDPYTHSEINREYIYIDSEGNPQIMDNEDNALAQWFSSVCKGFAQMTGWNMFDLSPSSAEALLSNFFGQASVDLAGSLGKAFSGDMVGALSVYGKQVAKPFTVNAYNQADSAWKETVKELQAKKQVLMQDNGELAKLENQLMYETDPTKQKTLRANIKKITQAYQDEVFDTVQKFNSIYGADYDYKKFASTINLLNFTAKAGSGLSEAALQDARELASDNKNAALMTMSEMGFNSTNDYSIFGYLKKNPDGTTEWKATLPTAIAYSTGSNFYTGIDETTAKLTNYFNRTTLSNGKKFKDAYNEMWDKANAYANAGKWNLRDKVLKDWDVQVMMGIYPILAENDLMDQYGNSLLDNKSVIDLLDDYIRVPSDFMGKGKYLSAKSGIDKNRGYAKSYIQKIYKQLKGGK